MADGAMVAAMKRQVKALIPRAAALLLALSVGVQAAPDSPSASEIMQRLRANQTEQHRTLSGSLRNGPTNLPFRLVLDGSTIKYQFTDPPYTLILRLGETGARLTEVTRNGSANVPDANFATPVRGSDLTFEDVAMRFLYWSNATVLGEDSITLRACWKVLLKPDVGEKTAYYAVTAWIDQDTGALLNAQALDAHGKLATEFKLIEPQMIGGLWLPRKVRIQRFRDGKPLDSSPTYLMIDKVLKE